MKQLASSASTERHPAHRWTGAFSAPRMRTRLGPSRTSSSLHRIPSISDALVVTRRHARVGLQTARCADRRAPLAENVTEVDLRAEGLRNARTGKGPAPGSPRAPSVVSRTRELSPMGRTRAEPFEKNALTRTVSPSLHPSPASGSALGFLLASALAHHEILRPPGAEDARCVQPTSATRTNDVHPLAVCSRLSRTAFAIRDARDNPRLPRGMTEEPGVFTTPETASAPQLRTRTSCLRPHGFRHERGPVRPATLEETRPLTPLSRSPSLFPLTHLRACWLRERLLMVSETARGSEEEEDRRDHRRRRLVKADVERMIRGAFRRQGLFVGSGGLYSPGPAIPPPLLAMRTPLDDALTSS